MKAGQSNDLGKNLLETSVHRILNEDKRITIPSPWQPLNELMDGGFGKKELYTIIAAPGAGKCVGPNTEIDIEYEQIGVEINGYTIWFEPWEIVCIDNITMPSYKFMQFIIDKINTADGGKSI